MKPGRELDALVAEKVMGWKYDQILGWSSPDGEFSGQPGPRSYSTDIAAAWQVVEKVNAEGIQGEGYRVKLEWDHGYWTCELVGVISMGLRFESAPHAICLAALKALDHPVN